ncbi:MAG: hypothetical protein AAGA95_03110 [Pseudomonadota bacterium]
MRWSVSWFTLAFCVAYAAIFALELPVPIYYPLTGVWSLSDVGTSNGTAMHWYGLTLISLLVGAVLGAVCSDEWIPQVFRSWIIVASWILMAVTVFLMRSFFGF